MNCLVSCAEEIDSDVFKRKAKTKKRPLTEGVDPAVVAENARGGPEEPLQVQPIGSVPFTVEEGGEAEVQEGGAG